MNHDYEIPEKGTVDWHIPLNDNFRRLDTDVEIRDVEGLLSQYEPKSNAKFLSTDTKNIYFGDGTQWILWASLSANERDPVRYVSDINNLQATIDSLAQDGGGGTYGGGRIILDEGTHRPNPDNLPIQLTGGLTICGVSKGGTKIDMSGVDESLFNFDRSNYGSDEDYVSIRDMLIWGDKTAGSKAVNLDSTHSWHLENLHIGALDAAITVSHSWNGLMKNCYLSNNRGVSLLYNGGSCNAIRHIGCYFINNESPAVQLGDDSSGAGSGLFFIGCQFEGNPRAILAKRVGSFHVWGCYTENNGNPNFDLRPTGGDYVNHCSFKDSFFAAPDTGNFIRVNNVCREVIVEGNYFQRGKAGVEIAGDTQIDVQIHNNNYRWATLEDSVTIKNGAQPRAADINGGHWIPRDFGGMDYVTALEPSVTGTLFINGTARPQDLSTVTGDYVGQELVDDGSNVSTETPLACYWTGNAWQPADGGPTFS